MKKTLATLALALVALAAQAQISYLPSVKTDVSVLMEMLRFNGYETFAYNLSNLKGEQYKITVSYKECAKGIVLKESVLNEFPVENCDTMTFGFFPADYNLKTKNIMVHLGERTFSLRPLRLKSFKVGPEEKCEYRVKSFRQGKLKIGEFQPLQLLGSIVFDGSDFDEMHYKATMYDLGKFSVEEFSEIENLIPHYYIIGMTVTKVE